MTVRPLFLFSLPRAGSTLVQRVLASHPEISTTAEPWLLLPQLYATRLDGIYTEYGQIQSTKALTDFARELPQGEDEYRRELNRFISRLYERASSEGAMYFLDKTPRYHLVVEEVFRVFPEAKFVFLWRNPLAVAASIVDTWAHGKWSFGWWRVDLYEGLASLIAAYDRHRDAACAARFEDLVRGNERGWGELFGYLQIPFDESSLSSFHRTELPGRMGDPTGRRQYLGISDEPLDKWKRTMANPVRKAWCRSYLRWIGAERMAMMDYDLDDLLAQVDALPSSARLIGSDLLRASYGAVTRRRRDRALRSLTERSRW